jgi:uncharacterized protein involved in outer membrane biogenesis
MKKAISAGLKVLIGIILLVLVLLFTVPVIFKEKIRVIVEQEINSTVNASVKFDDYRLGFFQNFPDLTFSLKNLSVVGSGKFANDTLAAFRSFDLVFNLKSLFKKSGYEVKSLIMDQAVINIIYLKDGTANYDIMKADSTSASASTSTSASASASTSTSTSTAMKILLNKVSVLNSTISYIDESSAISARFIDVNAGIKGDMTTSETDLQISLNTGEFTFIMDGMKYLNRAVVDASIDMQANLDKYIYTFRENYFNVNDLKINFSGMVAMPGDNIETDIKFSTGQTSFKTLLSLIPAVYLNDYKNLQTSGEFALSGTAKGIYSDADSTLPDLALTIAVSDGLISYPSLPEKIKNIKIKSDVFIDGKTADKSIVNVEVFHFELAGNPFDISFTLKTPVSDPEFKGSVAGKIDLTALSKAVPMDSISMSGIIGISVSMDGKMSMIEKSLYDKFKASGNMTVKNMFVSMIGYPEVKINDAFCEFTPAFMALTRSDINIGRKSDFNITGKLENYIPYVFNNKTIRGNFSVNSKLVDVSEILSKMGSAPPTGTDTIAAPQKEDAPVPAETAKASTITQVPENLDLDFNAVIDEFDYDKIKVQKLKGHIIVRDGILSIRETGMNILNGTISMNADYDTRDTLKPVMKADFDIQNIAVRDAFNTFNTVKKLAPAAKGIDGVISAKMNYSSLLGQDMMPVINTINGAGKITSSEITLLESTTFDAMKELLKLGNNYNKTFRDINISFKIADGRIYVSPFDVKTGNLKMNISGDQGIDETLNYLVKTEIPRADLGGSINSFIDNLSVQASAFGLNFKPSDLLRVNFKVTGTFSKPVVSPLIGNATGESGGGAKETAKEAVKQTIDNAVDQIKNKAKAEAEIEAARIVKEAEEKGQILRDEAAKAAGVIRKEADIQAQKLINEAASGGTLAKLGAQKAAETIRNTADKKANQIIQEADNQANKLVEEAKIKSAELVNSTLTDMKNRPVFTLYPQGEQAGFSAFTPWGRGKKAEKPDWILICQSRINKI